jgi:hypothetical protein
VKEHDAYLRELRRQRYIIVRKPKSGHVRVFCPCGQLVSTHSVNGGSDGRGMANFKAEVRRHELRHSNGLPREQQREHVQG